MASSLRSSLRSWILRGVGVLVAAVVVVSTYALFAYGTVAPCGILKQEIMARAEEQRSTGEDLLEQGAQALAGALGEEALEAKLENYSSLECAEFMWRAKTGESGEVGEAFE